MKPRVFRRLLKEPARRARRSQRLPREQLTVDAHGMLVLRTVDDVLGWWRIERWRPRGHVCPKCNNTRYLNIGGLYEAAVGVEINVEGKVASWAAQPMVSTCTYCSEFNTAGTGAPPWRDRYSYFWILPEWARAGQDEDKANE